MIRRTQHKYVFEGVGVGVVVGVVVGMRVFMHARHPRTEPASPPHTLDFPSPVRALKNSHVILFCNTPVEPATAAKVEALLNGRVRGRACLGS